jgi:putative FmdB family regulatory protein
MGDGLMPVYDFKCSECNEIMEIYVKSFTEIPEKCKCGKEKSLTKVNSFTKNKPILNGNGFYETDYKK